MAEMDVELEQGLKQVADLIQRKVIEPSKRREAEETELSEEMKLQHAWSCNIERVIFTEAQLKKKVKEMAIQISKDFEGKQLLAVGILTGAVCFMTDLLKNMLIPYQIDFMSLSSYGKGTTSSGSVNVKQDLSFDPAGKHVLIIEDLIDTGNTLKWLKSYLMTKNCASVKLCTLLDKKARRTETDVAVDYVGFTCPDEFVVGYGMDFAENYRCLPFVGCLKPEAYQ
ncbi:Hypoxanthine-guanine phosphoribosyltransferase [Hondaea fermentalgiana]|uniref:Hypoxanthine phosphoribosyltransferase n=1 Tax=Hondaea fermentalgiana TaxID=2315210 RepID=A0A2R5GAJ5_9STRA|nr:Hypoxanthine-guanine phosphoribosyltransferase [Hondaea fermentalgiana]|eukprot:GBG26768.1 Hypoxanthine-guanine phosphoribosyltransferase [Hondaea fermentalgiana]